ncbi:hypothetical protein SCUP234_10543 [Seiridium cupressi]
MRGVVTITTLAFSEPSHPTRNIAKQHFLVARPGTSQDESPKTSKGLPRFPIREASYQPGWLNENQSTYDSERDSSVGKNDALQQDSMSRNDEGLPGVRQYAYGSPSGQQPLQAGLYEAWGSSPVRNNLSTPASSGPPFGDATQDLMTSTQVDSSSNELVERFLACPFLKANPFRYPEYGDERGQWYHIFNIVFPNHQPPRSPYKESYVSLALEHLEEFAESHHDQLVGNLMRFDQGSSILQTQFIQTVARMIVDQIFHDLRQYLDTATLGHPPQLLTPGTEEYLHGPARAPMQNLGEMQVHQGNATVPRSFDMSGLHLTTPEPFYQANSELAGTQRDAFIDTTGTDSFAALLGTNSGHPGA